MKLLVVLGYAAILLGYAIYRALLPKPIPGIPYKKTSASRVFGDMPDALNHHSQTGEVFSYLSKTVVELNEPIIQMFMRPLSKPWVVISDYREAYDILARRTGEFDRADIHGDVFKYLVPSGHAWFPTDSAWKAHRKLIEGAMSTSFLTNIASHRVYASIQELIALWREKLRLARAQPFNAERDVERYALDTIWSVAFGQLLGATATQLSMLSGLDKTNTWTDGAGVVQLPSTEDPETCRSLMRLCNSVAIPLNSPLPRPHHWLALHMYPSLVKARRHKEKMLRELINETREKLMKSTDTTQVVDSAIEFVLRKEIRAAREAGRKAECDTQTIRDELFFFLLGGLETSTVTTYWLLKYISNDQRVQQKLRSALKSAFDDGVEIEKKLSVSEITDTNIPYLDAVIAEISRHSCAVSANVRMATIDTQILGHFIPKGTDVFLITNGPGFLTPPLKVDEMKRAKTSQSSIGATGAWDESNIGSFLPERWLIEDSKGETVFNSSAGPSMPFGAGVRQCYGRKLGSMQMKIFLTLLIWNFELQPLPEQLNSMKARDHLTHSPQSVHIKLAPRK